ncbi:MAG: hypothetical protein V4658_02985 [Bacteroidota bacterium]
MKQLISILLVVALSFQFSVKVGITGYYLANKDYIAKILCINRDKPEMRCDGKCYLKDQLKKQESQDQKLPASLKELSETILFLTSPLITSPKLDLLPFIVNYPPYILSVTAERAFSIFHPPQAV